MSNKIAIENLKTLYELSERHPSLKSRCLRIIAADSTIDLISSYASANGYLQCLFDLNAINQNEFNDAFLEINKLLNNID